MSDRVCAGGCGLAIPAANKSGFAWGHKNGCPTSPPPSTPDATTTELAVVGEVDVEIPTISISLTGPQLDRIWTSLSLFGKATAIATVLAVHE